MAVMENSQWRSRAIYVCIFAAVLLLSSVQPVSTPAAPKSPAGRCASRASVSLSSTPYVHLSQCYSGHGYQRHWKADWISNSHHTFPLWARHLWWEGHFGADEGGEGWPFPPEPRKLSRYSSSGSLVDEIILASAAFLLKYVTDHLLPSWTQGIWLVWYLVVGKSLNPASVDALISPTLHYAASYLGYAATTVSTILRVCSFFAVLYAMFLPHVNLRTVIVPEGPGDPSPEEGTSAHSKENLADETSTMDSGTSSMRSCRRFIIVITQILPPGWWPSMTRLLMYLLGKLFLVARFIVPRELITAILLCIGLWIYREMEEHRYSRHGANHHSLKFSDTCYFPFDISMYAMLL